MDRDSMATLIVSVGIPLLTAVSSFLIAMLHKKTQQIKQQIKTDEIITYIDILAKAIEDIVLGLNQELVDDYKEASKDGKLSLEEIEYVNGLAVNRILETLGEYGIEVLDQVLVDTKKYIVYAVEAQVKKLKGGDLIE